MSMFFLFIFIFLFLSFFFSPDQRNEEVVNAPLMTIFTIGLLISRDCLPILSPFVAFVSQYALSRRKKLFAS